MTQDWQSWAAIGVVIFTIIVFLSRSLRKKKKSGGCSNCSGSKAAPKQ